MDSAPTGYAHRDDSGPRGWMARWWLRRRTARVRTQLELIREGKPPGGAASSRPAPGHPPATTQPPGEPPELEQLRDELQRRVLVEQATGFLAGRHTLSISEALDVLREKAREGDRDVADVAVEVLADRRAPHGS